MTTGRDNGRPPAPVSNPSDRGYTPEPPDTLSEEAQELWYEVFTVDWVGESDRFLVEELCTAVDERNMYRRMLSLGKMAGGVDRVYKMSNGAMAMHPFVKEGQVVHARIMSILTELGFSPSSRSKLKIAMQTETEEDIRIRELMKNRDRDNNGS